MHTWQRIKENQALLPRYFAREKVIDTIRDHFKSQGFHEVFTPILVPVPSCEPNLDVYETELATATGQKRRAFLIMSPEFQIKKLLAAGMGNCFEITRAFRNGEDVSSTHNSEFTILEWYRVAANYRDVMEDVEKLFTKIMFSTRDNLDLKHFTYQDAVYDLSLPWDRISVAEAFSTYAQVSVDELVDESALLHKAAVKGYNVTADTTWEQVFYQILFNEIEPKLNQKHRPYFLYDYPTQQASLSKRKADDPRFAERFEVFLAGLELGNCFSELTDWLEQQKRFETDMAERQKSGKTAYPIDAQLIEALKTGLPSVSGIAVGIDRLVMLAADTETISDTLFFPEKELFDLE